MNIIETNPSPNVLILASEKENLEELYACNKIVSDVLKNKNYTDIFQIIYSYDNEFNLMFFAMRWIKIADDFNDSWAQLFLGNENQFFGLNKNKAFFENSLADRIEHIGAKTVDIISSNLCFIKYIRNLLPIDIITNIKEGL